MPSAPSSRASLVGAGRRSGNNLDGLQRHVKDESIDLVYLDPPFNSNATYNLPFAKQAWCAIGRAARSVRRRLALAPMLTPSTVHRRAYLTGALSGVRLSR
jgi:hypothetical protein